MSVATPPGVPGTRPGATAPPPPPGRPCPGRFDALLGPARLIVRLGGMIVKEISEIVRQPLLMLTLILGPFLVLALFGVGSTGQQPPVRTILVVPNDGSFSTDRGAYKDALSSGVELLDVTTNQNAALDRLRRRDADVVVILPPNVAETISNGQQAQVEIRYNAIDPIKVNYIQYLAYVQIAELNRLTLRAAAEQSQGQAEDIRQFTGEARAALDAIDAQIRQGNTAEALRQSQGLDQRATPVQSDLLSAAQILVGLAALSGVPLDQYANVAPAGQAATGVTSLRRNLASLQQDLARGEAARQQQIEDVQRLRGDVNELDRIAQTFKQIPPDVIAAPFRSDPQNVARLQPSPVLFYGPAVLALLLQHVGVTFGSLSLVRERLLGATELFAVAPISSAEILVGKYLAYTLVSLVVALALMALMFFGLGIPIFGVDQSGQLFTILGQQISQGQLRILGFDMLVVLLLIVASLGVGFLISALSSTEHQAVQLSMLVLLASVFFGGLFISLESIIVPIRYVGYVLPVTYGIQAFQSLMLQGITGIRLETVALGAIAAVLFVMTSFLAHGVLKRSSRG